MYTQEIIKHPDDLYWEAIENDLDATDQVRMTHTVNAYVMQPGPSTGTLIDLTTDSSLPVPPPRMKYRQESGPPVPRPRSLRNSPSDGFELIDISPVDNIRWVTKFIW